MHRKVSKGLKGQISCRFAWRNRCWMETRLLTPAAKTQTAYYKNLVLFSWTVFPPVSWQVMTSSSSSRETAVFKGHGDSTTQTSWYKSVLQIHSHGGMLLRHHAPSLVFCAPMKPVFGVSSLQWMASLRPALRSARLKVSKMALWPHQLAKPAQRWPFHVMVYPRGCPGQPQTWKVPGWRETLFLTSSRAQCFFWAGLSDRARYNQAEETQEGLQDLLTVAFDFISAS